MADAQPTIRYTQRAGKPVIEVAGTWTVFSMRGIRRMAEKALQAAGSAGKADRIVDAKTGRARSTPPGALEILMLAGGPDAEDGDRRTRPRPPCSRWSRTTCARPSPSATSNWLAHWLEEIGRNTVHLYEQGRESLRLLRRDPGRRRRGLPAAQALPPERGGPPDVRGVDPRPGDRGRAHAS